MTTSAQINSTEFPRLKQIEKEKAFWEQEIKDNPDHPTNMYSGREISRLNRELAKSRDERLAELEEKLNGKYVGGMTEYWQRQKEFLLSEKGQEISDVLDGPDQECFPLEIEGPWYPRPEPDDPTQPDIDKPID